MIQSYVIMFNLFIIFVRYSKKYMKMTHMIGLRVDDGWKDGKEYLKPTAKFFLIFWSGNIIITTNVM